MIERKKIQEIVDSYDKNNITIGVLGGHSGLDVCRGAKKHGFKTLAVCQKGREKTYTKYYKTRKDGRGCIDETIVLDKFSDITKPSVQEELRKKNTIFIHNRYFWVYFDFKDIFFFKQKTAYEIMPSLVGSEMCIRDSNYFYSAIDDELEIMGTDTRRQTNLDGLIRLPANEQLEVLKYMKPKIIETGHIAATTKESIIEKIFDLGEKFVATTKKECPPGIIGPFALQGAIAADTGKEEMVVFDVSMRIPGSPLTRFTPHSGYLYGDSISYGERIAMEIKKAIEKDKLREIVT